MPDVVLLVAISAIVVIAILVFLAKSLHTIPAGKVGFVYLFGAYRLTAPPGLNLVSPLAVVRVVAVGSGANALLGMTGTTESALGPDSLSGVVRIGDRTIAARSYARLPAGSTVRVTVDETPGIVFVAPEQGRVGSSSRKSG
jgi:membrane-bound ClpP family serine protease